MPVIYMEKASVEALTEQDIRKIISENSIGMKYGKLSDYYTGNHKILGETKRDSTAPNNKLVNNMAKYITDTATGYFVGKPIVYNSDNEEYLKAMQDVFDYNDEQDHNMELAKQCSICGSCFEMMYIDEDCKIRFTKVKAADLIMIYETETGFTTPLAAIRTIISRDRDGNVVKKVEYWNVHQVLYFRSVNNGYLTLERIEDHYWHDVPFTEYINNEERMGDFEGVISEIDAYNKVQSNTANYFQYNDDAILKVVKLGDVSSRDVADMKEKGAIILEDGGDVAWLLKSIDDTALENYKNRLRDDIHLGASVPNMTDDSFGSNSISGVAVSYKLWGLDQTCAIKERKFKRGIQRRIELITNMLNLMGATYDYRDIVPSFRRNKPQNVLETAQVITTLANDLSRETRLQMLPMVENVQDELAKLEAEKHRDMEDFGTYQNFAKAFQISDKAADQEAGDDT